MSISPSMNIKGILIQRKRNPPITYCKVSVKAEGLKTHIARKKQSKGICEWGILFKKRS